MVLPLYESTDATEPVEVDLFDFIASDPDPALLNRNGGISFLGLPAPARMFSSRQKFIVIPT
jgi:hypothetical protein